MIIKRLTMETIDDQLNLFRSTLSPNRTLELWKKRFAENPYTKNYYVYGALADNKIIGINGFLYMQYSLNDQIFHVVQSCDSCVNSEYRHQGVFSKIIMSAMQDFESEGMDYAIGFPNSNSYPAFIKMGWKNMPSIRTLFLPTKITRTIEDQFSLRVPAILNGIDILLWRKIHKYSKRKHKIYVYKSAEFFSDDLASMTADNSFQLRLTDDFITWWLKTANENKYVFYVAKIDDISICYIIIREFQDKNDLHADIIAYGRNREVSDQEYYAGMAKIFNSLRPNYSYLKVLVQLNIKNDLFRKMGMLFKHNGQQHGVYYVLNNSKRMEIMNYQNWCTKAIELDTVIL